MDKIYVIKTADYPNGMAGSIHSSLIVKGLRANGAKSGLLIPYADMGKEAGNVRIIGHSNGVPYFYLNKKTIHSRNKFIAFYQIIIGMLNTAAFVLKRYKKGKLDSVIIGTPDFFKFFPIILICYIYRIPLYLWAVEKMTLKLSKNGIKNRVEFLGFYLSEKFLPKISNGIIVISTFLKNYYNKFISEEKILISPILVDASVTKSEGSISNQIKEILIKDYLLYSGSFAQKDGLYFILEAFALILKRYPNLYLVMTGRTFHNKDMHGLYELIEKLKIKDKVIFTGLVSRFELEKLNLNSKILLVCRTNSPFANYGFPWKLGEYCLTENPIIATKVGDITKYFKDKINIFLAEPENSMSIADNMLVILENYKRAKEIAKKSRIQAIHHFNYLKETRKIKDFVQNSYNLS